MVLKIGGVIGIPTLARQCGRVLNVAGLLVNPVHMHMMRIVKLIGVVTLATLSLVRFHLALNFV